MLQRALQARPRSHMPSPLPALPNPSRIFPTAALPRPHLTPHPPAGPVWPDRALKGVCLCRWDNPGRPFLPEQQPQAALELLESAAPLLPGGPAAESSGL